MAFFGLLTSVSRSYDKVWYYFIEFGFWCIKLYVRFTDVLLKESFDLFLRCRDYDEKGFCLKGDLCKFDHGTDAVVLEVTFNYQVIK